MRFFFSHAIWVLVLFCPISPVIEAQKPVHVVPSVAEADSDRDGISDRIENSLLIQFAPRFMVNRQECSSLPAEFIPNLADPIARTEDGTIYGQVFPVKTGFSLRTAEVHFYHLWKKDCGAHGHPLDAEHVSVLVQALSDDLSSATWKARYWYAAAHEETVCDVSQIARAVTLAAEDRGPVVWISAGKHASFFNETLCRRGCGADVCRDASPLQIGQLINLGEPGALMNGALWAASSRWSLAAKMIDTDFPATAIARLSSVPPTEIALVNGGRHPMQGTIAISNSTAGVLANSGDNTAEAISIGEASTSNALRSSYDHTLHALGGSLRRARKALQSSGNPKSGR